MTPLVHGDLPNALERFRRDHRLQAEHLALLLGIDERALETLAAYPLPDPACPDFAAAVFRIAAEVGCEPDALRYMLVVTDQSPLARVQPHSGTRNRSRPHAAGAVRREGRDHRDCTSRETACQAEPGG